MAHVTEISVLDASSVSRDVATLDALMALIGEVQASPTSNTALDRLKTLATSLTTISGYLDGVETKLDTIHTDLGGTPSFNIGNADSTTQRVVGAGVGMTASAAFTPAAASHVANDCNGAAAEFDFNAPAACHLMITDASLTIAGGTAEATAWRLYLYTSTPASAIADDGAWTLDIATDTTFVGYVDLGTAIDLGSTQWVQNSSINRVVKLTGDSLFGYLVNLTTLTPAAVAHTVKLTTVLV